MLRSAASKCRRGSYEKMRPVPRKARIRCPLPQLMERPLVGSHSILFVSLRGAIQHQTSLVQLSLLRQSAELRNRSLRKQMTEGRRMLRERGIKKHETKP
jgi:hypothetical protein